ncbi:MAG: flagellar assembly protein FliW [Victivallales bacterium]|nr:flagellar assembly protein FliW [Victivallales bacterium]
MSTSIDFATSSLMEIGSRSHCVVKQVNPENVFRFPDGIIGFSDIGEYIFLVNEKVAPFMFMQALDQSGLSFVCVETFLLKSDYSIRLPESYIRLLQLDDPADCLLISLVTVNTDIRKFTANLMSPVILNMKKSLGCQFVPEASIYPVRFNIWDGLEKLRKNQVRAG